jgi:protein O-mannosyl-transferase
MPISKTKVLPKWMCALAAIVITGIAFYPSLMNGWTNWDDEVYVLNNDNIREFSWGQIKYWFTEYHHGNYHPLTMISYMVEYSIAELNPVIYHFTNYLLHLMNTGLVFFFIFKLIGRKDVALITAILFGVHPMHVESVAWISERKDLLYTAFYLGSLLVYLGYKQTPDWKKYIILLLLFSGSLLSKSAAVVLPVVLLLIDYFQCRKLTPMLIIEKVPLFGLSVIFGILAIKSQNATEAIASYDVFTTTQRILFAGYGSMVYIEKALWPSDLTAFHPYPSLVENGTRLPYVFYIMPCLSVIVFGGSLLFLKRSRLLVFGLFFYLINVALVLQFVSVGSAIYAERYSYMAYIGLFFLFAMVVAHLIENKPSLRKLIYGFTAVLCLALSWLTFNQSKTWSDSVSLWEQFNEVHPESAHGEYKIAEFHMDAGNNQQALDQFLYIGNKYPTAGRAHMGAGNIFGKMGKLEESLVYFNKAADHYAPKGNMEDLWVNRAITLSMLKQHKQAFEDYAKALQYKPNNTQIYVNRGFTYLEFGDFEKAISDFTIVLQFQPSNERIHFMKALAYHRANKLESAVSGYNDVLQINPNNSDALHNRAICFEAAGKYKQALEGILTAQKLGKQENAAYIQKLQKLANQ